MKQLTMILTMVGLMLASSLAHGGTALDAAKDGADYLVGEQISGTGDPTQDGGWTWNSGTTAAVNIAGPTAYGLVRYYNAAGGSAYLDAAKAASDFISNTTYAGGEARYSTFDPYFNWQLSLAASDNTYSNRTKTEFFDILTAGTYGDANYDTAGWIGAVQTARTGTWVNLRPWEFSTIAVTAKNIGNSGQEALFKQGILDGLETLDNTAPGSVYSDLIGVTGGVRGLALDDVTTFTAISSSNHAGIDGIDSLLGLANYLADQQNTDGSWYWHSGLATPGEDDKDTQTTSYAVLALEAAADALSISDYDDEIADGRTWLMTMQVTDAGASFGGFLSYSGDLGDVINNEISGEAVAALVPEPVTMSMLAVGGLALIRRKRRRA